MHFEATQLWEQLKQVIPAPPLPNIPKYKNDNIKNLQNPKLHTKTSSNSIMGSKGCDKWNYAEIIKAKV